MHVAVLGLEMEGVLALLLALQGLPARLTVGAARQVRPTAHSPSCLKPTWHKATHLAWVGPENLPGPGSRSQEFPPTPTFLQSLVETGGCPVLSSGWDPPDGPCPWSS